ncbi:MAG: putative DNA-binding domain-containing protein [Cellvibrio sp.]|uniref:HvfC family RiPP maturation protein n=1 Tax=Cellvibrio sp. TaxID=1965322 RepID=UPI0031A2948D
MKSFQETQLAFAKHLRAPDLYPAPVAIDERRVGIYRELIYNNIENFIANVFPVIRSLVTDDYWHSLVREFIHRHSCQTPYFLEISEEFLQFLMSERGLRENDPVFLLELAHYEWIELALDVNIENIPHKSAYPENLLLSKPRVSPLVVCLTYQYPVHKISPTYQPVAPEPTRLLVYRNRVDKVCFMAANAITLRLLYLLQTNLDECLEVHLSTIASELQLLEPGILFDDSERLIAELFALDIISHFD